MNHHAVHDVKIVNETASYMFEDWPTGTYFKSLVTGDIWMLVIAGAFAGGPRNILNLVSLNDGGILNRYEMHEKNFRRITPGTKLEIIV